MNNNVKKCCICNNKKIGEFITINDNKYHLCCIEQFQQENNQLKKMVNHKHKYCSEMEGKYILEKYKLDQLRSWLEKQVFNRGGSSIDIAIEIHTFCKVLDKLNELEGGKNE